MEAGNEGGSTESVEATQETVRGTLELMGIRRVVVVDDDFEADLHDVIASVANTVADFLTVAHIGEVDLRQDRELWEGDLRDAWAELTAEEREGIAGDVGASLSADGPVFDGLAAAFAPSVELDFLSPAAWETRKDALTASADAVPTLVLFDRDMGGDSEAGTRLVVSLLLGADSDSVWSGLLTNTTTPDDEGTLREDLVEQMGEAGDRFVVVSKGHLADGRVDAFGEALRLALVQRPASRLLSAVNRAIQMHAAAAASRLEDLSPAQFERIVFGLSKEEGTWEVDMLLRLFDAYLRTDVRESLHGNLDVRGATRTLRELHDLRSEQEIPISIQARSIYRRELYDEGDHLAAVGSAVELGDVFEKETGGKLFVVVGQPCDLMVRSDGKRAPELDYLTVLPISGGEPRDRTRAFELPAFSDDESWWARLDRPEIVPAEALDFCVYDSEGRAVAPSSGAEDNESWRLPSLERRRLLLANECDKLRVQAGSTSGDQRRSSIRSAYGVRSNCIVKPVLENDGKNFGFGLRRTRRVLPPFSRALLSAYSAFQARDDFDRALA